MRYPCGVPNQVHQQIEHELSLIADMRYEAYFLTVYDIVKFAREQGILCQGRSSAANSAVCYALGLMKVDVLHSAWETTLQGADSSVVRLGLQQIRGFDQEAGERIATAQPFRDVEDLSGRTGLNLGHRHVTSSSRVQQQVLAQISADCAR